MALIAENGIGLPNADSFASVTQADAYHKAMGNDGWFDFSTSEKEVNLRRATQYMQGVYRRDWIGVPCFSYQALAWPREWVEIDGFPWRHDQIPPDVPNACALLALKAGTEPLTPDLEPEIEYEKVGPIETRYRHGPQYKRFREVDLMLAHLLRRNGNVNLPMVRS